MIPFLPTFCIRIVAIIAFAFLADKSLAAQVTILSQPVDRQVWPGNKGYFSVQADAAGAPLTYQWQLDGVDIPRGTNATFITDYTRQLFYEEIYRVIISAPGYEPVTSRNARLLVKSYDPISPILRYAGRRAGSDEILVVYGTVIPPLGEGSYTLDRGAEVIGISRTDAESDVIVHNRNMVEGTSYRLTVNGVRSYDGSSAGTQSTAVQLYLGDPSLTITRTNDTITVSWTTPAPAFELETSTDISDLWRWRWASSTFTAPPTFTIDRATPSCFFRLRKP